MTNVEGGVLLLGRRSDGAETDDDDDGLLSIDAHAAPRAESDGVRLRVIVAARLY